MKFTLNPQKTRLVAIVSAVAIGALAIGAGGTYLVIERSRPAASLPVIKEHADLPSRPMESFAASLTTAMPADLATLPESTCPALATNWVAQENQKPGVNMSSTDWSALELSNAAGSALWLDKSSASCGEKIHVHASLYESQKNPDPPGPRHVVAWRVGYYHGSGAREVWRSGPINLKKLNVMTSKDATLYTEARWPINLTFTVGQNWTPGFYLIMTMSPFGTIENAAPLIIRSPLGSSKLVMMQSTFTWEMYNSFGGRSAYLGPGADGQSDEEARSRVASYDRPLVGSGAYSVQRDVIPFLQFTEEHGINIDQVTDLNIDQSPSLLSHYNGVIVGGHAEYFTHRLFESFIAARNQGRNIAVFGGNTAFWQTRLAPSKSGPNRHLVMYRSATQDPITNLSEVTIQFGNNRLNTPPNLITGEITRGVHVYGDLKSVAIPKWLGIPTNSMINAISSDTEAEAIKNNLASPPNIHTIFAGTLHWRDKKSEIASGYQPSANTTWFTTPSGSAVFNAGLSTWSCNVSASCVDTMYGAAGQLTVQAVTLAVLKWWQIPEVGKVLK
jgi:hypothetical protein